MYLFALYNVLFATIIIIMDGKPEWYKNKYDLQRKLFSNASFLAKSWGRAGFYFFVGSLNFFMLPYSTFWQFVYFIIALSLCAAGVGIIAYDCISKKKRGGSVMSREVAIQSPGEGAAPQAQQQQQQQQQP